MQTTQTATQTARRRGQWMDYDTAQPVSGVRGVRAQDSRDSAKQDGGAGVVRADDGLLVYWQD